MKLTKEEIRNQANAWDLRTKDAPKLNPETQPNLYKWAVRLGIKEAIY